MSEILKEYAKIAQAQGLVDMKEQRGGEEKKPPRYDSLTWEKIQMLYGVKPEGTEKCILDKVHPDTYVVGRAYDAMNAVVENLHQRQNVMADIALRNPDGLLTQKRYVKAYSDLMNSIVRIGFEMDNKDEARLMKIADSCAGRLKKEAITGLEIGALVAGVAALGFLGWSMYADDSVQSVHQNAQRVIDEAEDLADDGVSWAPQLIEEMTILQGMAVNFKNVSDQLMASTGADRGLSLQSAVVAQHSQQPLLQQARQYEHVLRAEQRNLKYWLNKTRVDVNALSTEESSWDWWQKVKDVYETVVPTDLEDVQKALNGLNGAIAKTLKQVAIIRSQVGKHAKALEQAEAEFQTQQQGQPPVAAAPPGGAPDAGPPVQLSMVGQPAAAPAAAAPAAAPAGGAALPPYKG
jgi:hypothetical protein